MYVISVVGLSCLVWANGRALFHALQGYSERPLDSYSAYLLANVEKDAIPTVNYFPQVIWNQTSRTHLSRYPNIHTTAA